MTAELAVAVPAVVLVLAACLGGLRIGAERIRLTDEAGLAARSVARGEPGRVEPGAVVRRHGALVCVDLRRTAPILGVPVPVLGTGCALSGAVS